jgi:integrase/recombinase XerD
MKNNIYVGPFKKHLQNHIALKKALGYKYDAEAEHLMRFDKFTMQKYPNARALTKEIVLEWCRKRTYEAQANQLSRASIIRQFGKYLDSIEIKAYIIPKGHFPSEKKYVPYIFSVEELTRFFVETDKCQYCNECPYRHFIMPVIFRMIYTCGLRPSEARLLKVTDVDLENGVLTIHQSKRDKSRLVPMSKSLTDRCRAFSKKVHSKPIGEHYYFPGHLNKPMTIGNVYHNFRKFLWRAKISHGGKGCGPRIYDFRHSYGTHCLKRWSETYMGHDSFYETAYYLHLTVDMFPDITGKLELRYPRIIPELERGIDETY